MSNHFEAEDPFNLRVADPFGLGAKDPFAGLPYHSESHRHLSKQSDDPPYPQFWWHPPNDSGSMLSQPAVASIGHQIQQSITASIDCITSISTVRDGTEQVTRAVAAGLRRQGYDCRTEVPFTHELIDGHGRADIMAFAPDSPALYVEIDSTPTAANIKKNASKLEAAWMMGAVPIWIGWHTFDPRTFKTDFPVVKLRFLENSPGIMKEAAYRKSAETTLNELSRIVEAVIAKSPEEGRCNVLTQASTLCRKERGMCRHDGAKETLDESYADQVLKRAIQITERMLIHRSGHQPSILDDCSCDDGPAVLHAPEEELLPPTYE